MRGCTKYQLQHQGLQQGLRLSQHKEFSMWLCLPRHVQKTSQCAFNCCVVLFFFSHKFDICSPLKTTVVFLPIPSDPSLERASPVSIAANIPPVHKCGKKHNCAAKAFYLAQNQSWQKPLYRTINQKHQSCNASFSFFFFFQSI